MVTTMTLSQLLDILMILALTSSTSKAFTCLSQKSSLSFINNSSRRSITTSSRVVNTMSFSTNNSNDNGEDNNDEAKEQLIQQRLLEHQQKAAVLNRADDARTLVQYNHGFAVISTNSKGNPGYPVGSVVGFAPDEAGRPLFSFSTMSGHTRDILSNPKCSLTIASKEFKGASDGRLNLMGTMTTLDSPEEIAKAKELYLQKHPGSFWTDFGDFAWYRLTVEDVKCVGGFARAYSLTAKEYTDAKPDPIAAFGMHIANHMNEDHMDSTIAMIEQQIPGLDVKEAIISSVDSYGMFVRIKRGGDNQYSKIRLPFPRQAKDRKDVKDIIVEMTRAAASAATASNSSSSEDV
jgi:putative heme iron utilization protein